MHPAGEKDTAVVMPKEVMAAVLTVAEAGGITVEDGATAVTAV
jgi:hypothetical protein